ncbi:unnamed protein product, partial [Porites evermanni]
ATIDCISVPRCTGNLLQGFRYLVLMTATTLKKSSHSCHKLDVKMLERYVKGMLLKAWERGCISLGIKGILDVHNGELKQQRRRRLRKRHLKSEVALLHSLSPLFHLSRWPCDFPPETPLVVCGVIPVNRVILHCMCVVRTADGRSYGHVITKISRKDGLPNFLRYGALLARVSARSRAPNVRSWGFPRAAKMPAWLWPHLNGKKMENLVTWYKFTFAVNVMLNLSNKNSPHFATPPLVSPTVFEEVIREVFLWKIRDCIGESMQSILTATFTPEFWLHHTFIDKLWAKWARHITDRELAHYRNTTFKMPGLERFAWEYMSLIMLPGGVIVVYEE